jgi:Protein of Unknown function (DUF2784)
MLQMAILMVALHAAYLFGVIFGAFWTRRRPGWSAIHVAALVWGIIVEVGPWPCPLTLAEEYFIARTTYAAYQQSHLLHLLNAIVYPDLPAWLVASAGVAVCVVNLGIYGWRLRKALCTRRADGRAGRQAYARNSRTKGSSV